MASRSLALLLVTLCVMELGVAWPQMISKTGVCDTFNVAHVNSRNLTATVLAVNLLDKEGEPVTCVEASQTSYTLEVRSTTDRKIRGFLLREVFAEGKVPKGIFPFPYGILPENVAVDVCGNGSRSVSHRCPFMEGCSFGRTLHFGYRSRRNIKEDIVFRYTVVFTEREYIGNITKVIPVCPVASPTHPVTTDKPTEPATECDNQPQPHENNLTENNLTENTQIECSNFTVNGGALKTKKIGSCGKTSYNSNDTHIHQDPETNVNYTCHTNRLIRRTQCNASCSTDGERWCCKILRVKYRRRNFTCEADASLNPNNTGKLSTRIFTLVREQTKGCVCYPCSQVTCIKKSEGCQPRKNTNNSLLRIIT